MRQNSQAANITYPKGFISLMVIFLLNNYHYNTLQLNLYHLL
jgi:hypothetical protein